MIRPALGMIVLMTAASAPQPDSLKGLAFLVGTWSGSGTFPDGRAYVDEHRFEWIQDRHFLKAEYVLSLDGKPFWTTTSILGWDPAKKKLVGFSFAMNGAIARTEEAPGGGKDVWVFEGTVVSPRGSAEDRVTHRRIDDDAFTTTVETKKDGAYAIVDTYAYRRKK